jgi:signal transduction histidine kinase
MIDQRDSIHREPAGRILQIAEREIGRIILDIHDGPVQHIFAALSQLYIVQKSLTQHCQGNAIEELERVQRSINLLEHSLNEIRTFMGTFRPPEFERRDLIAVLEGLVIQHEELTGSTVELIIRNPIPPVALPVKISLYRIVQEALSNAARHGKVDHHTLLLASDDCNILLEVQDEGVGFDLRKLAQQPGLHFGLEGMRERVRLLNGNISIQSAPGQGTRVQVVVPCH